MRKIVGHVWDRAGHLRDKVTSRLHSSTRTSHGWWVMNSSRVSITSFGEQPQSRAKPSMVPETENEFSFHISKRSSYHVHRDFLEHLRIFLSESKSFGYTGSDTRFWMPASLCDRAIKSPHRRHRVILLILSEPEPSLIRPVLLVLARSLLVLLILAVLLVLAVLISFRPKKRNTGSRA